MTLCPKDLSLHFLITLYVGVVGGVWVPGDAEGVESCWSSIRNYMSHIYSFF